MYERKYNAIRVTAVLLALILCITSMPLKAVEAAAPKLGNKTLSITVGKSKTLRVKNIKKVTWSSSKSKIISLSKKKKTSVRLTAKKIGTSTVTAKYKLKKKTKKLVCKVKATRSNTSITVATATPAVNQPTTVPTMRPTVESANGTWAYYEKDANMTLLKALGDIFGNVGTCLTYNYNGLSQMQDSKIMEYTKDNYNSITLENEMKPDAMLSRIGWTRDLDTYSTKADAENNGYTIPEAYTEETYPIINYSSMDKALEIAAKNGLKLRGHTLIWHSQTPDAFFKVGYRSAGEFVTPEVMDQRIIYYITNVMKHVYDGPYANSVYSWDVVNEYYHQLDGSTLNWSEVYDIASYGVLTRNPEYVKLSFKTAYEVLESYGLQGKVSLLYNDFNMSDLTTRVISLVNYVNKSDELNPEAKRYCDGVGMQSHLSVQSLPVYQQLATVGYFLEEGFEVQITELDITTNSKDVEEHADYWYTFIKGLIDQKKAGGNITGITLWGLYDAVSWRKEESPLLYDKNMNDPKKSLYAVFAASQTY